MDLSSLRTAYALGNYQLASTAPIITNLTFPQSLEYLVLKWKSILRATGDVSQAAQSLISISASFPRQPSELLKKALILWSKAFKTQNSNLNSSPGNSNVAALTEIGIKAFEAAELEPEEREQTILLAAEGILLISPKATMESFSLLKLVKASNLDCQVMFIEILIRLGQFKLARDRLNKMRSIPEWTDDVRFILTESVLSISAHGFDGSENHLDTKDSYTFTIKDALYSYQELIQIHGTSTKLACGLSASFALLSKFNEAQNNLINLLETETDMDVNIQANLLALSALTASDSSAINKNLK